MTDETSPSGSGETRNLHPEPRRTSSTAANDHGFPGAPSFADRPSLSVYGQFSWTTVTTSRPECGTLMTARDAFQHASRRLQTDFGALRNRIGLRDPVPRDRTDRAGNLPNRSRSTERGRRLDACRTLTRGPRDTGGQRTSRVPRGASRQHLGPNDNEAPVAAPSTRGINAEPTQSARRSSPRWPTCSPLSPSVEAPPLPPEKPGRQARSDTPADPGLAQARITFVARQHMFDRRLRPACGSVRS